MNTSLRLRRARGWGRLMRCDRRMTDGQWKLMLGERMTWWFSSSTSAFPHSTRTRARRALQMFSGSKFWFNTNTGTLFIALSLFCSIQALLSRYYLGFIILLEVQPVLDGRPLCYYSTTLYSGKQ